MDNVVDFAAARERAAEDSCDDAYDPHLAGPAKCLACSHEWMVVTPVGPDYAFDLPCPKCDLSRGQLMYPPLPDEGMIYHEHHCGSRVLVTTARNVRTGRPVDSEAAVHTMGDDCVIGLMCVGCGEIVGAIDFNAIGEQQ